jgi:amino acid adenylation domain-containing protein
VQFNLPAETLIAVIMDKGIEQIISILAILNIGAAYMPIEPMEDKNRIRHLLKQGNVKFVLIQDHYKNFLSDIKAKTITLKETSHCRKIFNVENYTASNQQLAYVIYTSGSTGIPKGVMITHAAAINTILDINSRFHVTHMDRIYSLSSLAFDLSVYDIFGAFAAGSAVVIPPFKEVKSPSTWIKQLIDFGVTIWDSVPSYFQMLLTQAKYATEFRKKNKLRLALLSGDWIPLTLPVESFKILPKTKLISLGGATEASIWSILYPIEKVDPAWRSVPYGKPMRNQTFYIYAENTTKLVLKGDIGELCIGGAGIAKGYLNDPVGTQKKFITHPDTGEMLYRTGDLGRYMSDGNIEILGRLDTQIKLSGYRIDLSGLESIITKHPLVETALILPFKREKRYVQLNCFVIPKGIKKTVIDKKNVLLEDDSQKSWELIYDNIYLSSNDKDNSSPFNISGWINSATGLPYSVEEMREWVNQTINRLKALPHESILDIGCGTGLILFALIGDCLHYTGTDFSTTALAYVEKNIPKLNQKKVTLVKANANQSILGKRFNLVILNSVIQYFSSERYLISVIENALCSTQKNGKIFIGDVRNLEMLPLLYKHLFIQRYDGRRDGMDIWMQHKINTERELLVSPNFFRQLPQQYSRITQADILVKKGDFLTEMNLFRYDVILHLDQLPTHKRINKYKYRGYKDLEKNLCQFIKNVKDCDIVCAISNIPNSRLISLYDKSDIKNAIYPNALWALAERYNVELYLTYANKDPMYGLDAYFYKRKPEEIIDFGIRCDAKNTTPLVNSPMTSLRLTKIEKELRTRVKKNFPHYVQINHFIFLSQFPLTKNGKIDRKALTSIDPLLLTRIYIEPFSKWWEGLKKLISIRDD